MKFDMYCPKVVSPYTKSKKLNFKIDWCMQRRHWQNQMNPLARHDAMDCCDCEVGIDIELSLIERKVYGQGQTRPSHSPCASAHCYSSEEIDNNCFNRTTLSFDDY